MLYSCQLTTYLDITGEEDPETIKIEDEIADLLRDCWRINYRFNPIPQCNLSHLGNPFWKINHGPKHGAVWALETEAVNEVLKCRLERKADVEKEKRGWVDTSQRELASMFGW